MTKRKKQPVFVGPLRGTIRVSVRRDEDDFFAVVVHHKGGTPSVRVACYTSRRVADSHAMELRSSLRPLVK